MSWLKGLWCSSGTMLTKNMKGHLEVAQEGMFQPCLSFGVATNKMTGIVDSK